MTKLSEHFSLSEFTISQEAARRGLDNTPTPEIVENMKALCENILEPLRTALGPVVVTSGYRAPAVNVSIGGAQNSQHTEGKAADIHIPGVDLKTVFNYIFRNLSFDQVIYEFGQWVHVSYDANKRRGTGLLASHSAAGTVYTNQGYFA